MPNVSHMDAHRFYDLTVVHLSKCILNLGPRVVKMLLAPCYLNPALSLGGGVHALKFSKV